MSVRAFNWTFLASFTGGLAFAALCMLLLERAGRLPPPPFTATPCIDDKFQFLHEADLRGIDFLAMGSSVTLHSLNLDVLKERLPSLRPLNAAPCHLHVDQAAFMADFLLERMPDVRSVLTIVAPRDFESCDPRNTAFFDSWKANQYVFNKRGEALVYLTGFRPRWFVEQIRLSQQRDWNRFGSRPMYKSRSWATTSAQDERCMEALTQFESKVAAHGARLIVATLPIMPAWARAMGAEAQFIARWHEDIRRALRRPESVLIDGRQLQISDEDFADPLHLLWPSTPQLATYIADRLEASTLAHAREPVMAR